MTQIRITHLEALDIRFPTSDQNDGSDAMHPDPDYSAAYVILRTSVDGKTKLLSHDGSDFEEIEVDESAA